MVEMATMMKGYVEGKCWMSLRWVTCVFALAGVALMPRIAFGQTPTPPSGSSFSSGAPAAAPTLDAKQRGHHLLLEGNRLVRQQKWAEAEAIFETSWALNPTVEVAFNLGSVELWIGKPVEAAEHLSFALRSWPVMDVTDAMGPLLPVAERLFRQAKQAIGVLKIEVNVAKAEVFLDGEPVGDAPLRRAIFVTPGEHTVEAKRDGYASAKELVALDKGAEKTVRLTLAPTKRSDVERQAGRPDGDDAPPLKGDATAKPRKEIVIAGVATSAAAITAGVVFAIVSSVKAADANDRLATLVGVGGPKPCSALTLLPECRDIDRANKSADTFSNLSAWGFIAGGVIGAGTAIYALTSPKWAQMGHVRPLPVATAKGGGLLLVGEW